MMGAWQVLPLHSLNRANRPDSLQIKKVNQSHYRPEVPRGFQEVKAPGFRDNSTGCR